MLSKSCAEGPVTATKQSKEAASGHKGTRNSTTSCFSTACKGSYPTQGRAKKWKNTLEKPGGVAAVCLSAPSRLPPSAPRARGHPVLTPLVLPVCQPSWYWHI